VVKERRMKEKGTENGKLIWHIAKLTAVATFAVEQFLVKCKNKK